jgi:hypothetical protein
VLWERSVVEQHYDAVREVLEGRGVTEVATRYGVSRQSVTPGWAGIAPAAVCQLRRTHPGWGPARLGWELERRGVGPRPSRVAIWRILARNGLVDPQPAVVAATIGPGSARRRCRCGRWTSWVGSGWSTAGGPRGCPRRS